VDEDALDYFLYSNKVTFEAFGKETEPGTNNQPGVTLT